MFYEMPAGGLVLLCHNTAEHRRPVVYFHSGAYTGSWRSENDRYTHGRYGTQDLKMGIPPQVGLRAQGGQTLEKETRSQ